MRITPLFAVLASVLLGCGDGAPPDVFVDLGDADDVVYVTASGRDGSGGNDLVHLFDLATLDSIGAWRVGNAPGEVHATPDGSLVWVLNGRSGTVGLLDTATGDVRTIDVGVRPVHSYITPGYEQIWVGNDGSANVSMIAVATREVVETVVTGAGHHKMAFATDDLGAFTFGYVSNITDGTITPVMPDGTVLPNVPGVGAAPHGMNYAASTSFVYNCSGDAQNSIEVIATRDDPMTTENEQHTIVERIPLVARCGFIHVDESGELAHATLGDAGLLAEIRLSDHTVQTFDACEGPDKFEIVGDRAYVTCTEAPELAVVDLTGATPTTTIAVGNAKDPSSTDEAHRGIRRYGSYLFVPNAFDGTVSVVDIGTNTVVRTWTGIDHPANIAVAGASGGTTYPR